MQYKQIASKDLTKQFPQITSANKRRVMAGVRPFRKGGIRLQKQQINGKTVIHNYGHGGAGVSLAPATAQQAATLALLQAKEGGEVIVLGCGIVGILTALACKQKGLSVSIHAQRIPKPNQTIVSLMFTSEVAPGYWLPYHYQYSDQIVHDKRSEVSYHKYLQWMQKVKSLRKIQVYQDMDINQIKLKAPTYVSQTCKPITLKVGNKQFNMITFETIQIHLLNFLQQLLTQCKQKGIKIYENKFNNTNDICKLPANVLINCLGLASKSIFGDHNIYGIKGHLIQFSNSTKIKGIFGFKHQGLPVKLYCFDDKILVGLTKQDVENTIINNQLVQVLEKRVYQFYELLGLKKNQMTAKL